ncbi:RNA exonuclease 5 [Amphibalanus amphitrite]|uniref:RNA exonuclease 5 n=1 Tax=Amphibalanus amphitrite TaxID=1232801 RepID=A0A6A4V1S0_AMPAM|nr:RNA exonuclease 5 [Amphibalanus amphitrite]
MRSPGVSAAADTCGGPAQSEEQSQGASSAAADHSAHSAESTQAAPSSRALSRQERKRKKLQALLELVVRNDSAKAAASDAGETAVPSKKVRRKPQQTERLAADTTSAEREDQDQQKDQDQDQAGAAAADYRLLRQTLRKKRRKQRVPEFRLSCTGDHASLLMAAHSRTPIFLRDVQTLLLNAVWGDSESPGAGAPLPRTLPEPAAVGRTALLLDISQLMDEGYPLPGAGQYSKQFAGFVPTKDKYKPVTDQSPMYSIDCEMCVTRSGSELTSISVLDESEQLVYGTLVKPDNPILDYVTRYSGITAERLEMMHPYIIDTSVIFNVTGVRHRKTKLSLLSYMFLGETIQNDVTGHDATEDALAALRLVQRKLARGYTYGDAAQGGYVPCMNGSGPEPEDDSALPAAVNMDGYYTSLLGRVQEVGVTTSIVASGPGADIYRVACEATSHPSLSLDHVPSNRQVRRGPQSLHQVPSHPSLSLHQVTSHPSLSLNHVPSNRQACDRAGRLVSSADLTLCHMELRDRLHWSWPAGRRRRHLARLDKRLRRLYRAAPERCLITVVCAGAGGQTGDVENGVCLTAVKLSDDEVARSSAENDDTDDHS